MNGSEPDPDYDLRQIALMEEQLSQFEAGRIALPHLIAGLKALLSCMRTLGQDWKESFQKEWWTLEQVHAVALDRKETVLSLEDLTLIKEATGNLRTLIADVRERLEPSQS
jgi:hypothetical protein